VPKTPVHSFRAAAELVAAARRKASERGETLSDIIRRALERYVK
jgi:hypothetical protein